MEKFFYFHDLRKEMQVKTVYAGNLILREIARRAKLRWADLEWLNSNELKLILKEGKLSPEEIRRRKKAVLVLIDKNGYKLLSGSRAIKFANSELVFKNEKIKSLQGVGASIGRTSGKVKVCNGAEEALKKIKKGDILVCPMTLPDYVPAMKKAKAIITDEGGITCHAAIISRELNIPCIVETKIATRVLKDGDYVEVDANKGIINKI
jgi:phosphoenolpyruvate synthase/pyruvate phosphate dikinase